jgi:hypothetical protein
MRYCEQRGQTKKELVNVVPDTFLYSTHPLCLAILPFFPETGA